MAKKSVRISRNFDFGKLERAIPKILNDGMRRIGRSAAKSAKKRIDDGLFVDEMGKKFKEPLKYSTLALRKERGTGGSKPLFETGELHRSIKPTKEGFEMLEYGIYHNEGYTVKNVPLGYEKKSSGGGWQQSKPIFHPTKKISKKVPARPFIYPLKEEILDPIKKIVMDMRKKLRTSMKEIT